LEVLGKGIRGEGRVADKEAYTVRAINIISQWQYIVTQFICLQCIYFTKYMYLLFYLQVTDVGKAHRFVPVIVL